MASYIPRLWQFLREVGANNNRPWFMAHKEEYDELRRLWFADLDRLVAAMAEWEPELRGLSGRSVAYRFYRDIRFSPDKSPYKTYFSASISRYGRKAHMPGYYLHMGPHEMTGLYGGMWMPDSQMLRKLRNAIVDNIEEFTGIISEPEFLRFYPEWFGESLKTVPKGWPKDHPNADLLRLKEYGRWTPLDEHFFASNPDWPQIVADRFRLLKPLNDFLSYSLEEEIFTL